MQSPGIEPQITPGPFLGFGMNVPPEPVRAHQNIPLPQCFLRGTPPKLEQGQAIIIPTANDLEPSLPGVVKRFPDQKPGLPGHFRIESLGQCPSFPIVPRVMTKGTRAHPSQEASSLGGGGGVFGGSVKSEGELPEFASDMPAISQYSEIYASLFSAITLRSTSHGLY